MNPTKLFMAIIPLIFVGVIVGFAAFALISMEQDRNSNLHDSMIRFCEYWNDGVYSDCEEWTKQTMDTHKNDMRSCLNDYDDYSLAELGCVSGVIE